jgi:hypothetical protein
MEIEATVIVWQVDGALPWATPTWTFEHSPGGQRIGIDRVLEKLRRDGARVQERVLSSVRNLLGAVRIALRTPAVP